MLLWRLGGKGKERKGKQDSGDKNKSQTNKVWIREKTEKYRARKREYEQTGR